MSHGGSVRPEPMLHLYQFYPDDARHVHGFWISSKGVYYVWSTPGQRVKRQEYEYSRDEVYDRRSSDGRYRVSPRVQANNYRDVVNIQHVVFDQAPEEARRLWREEVIPLLEKEASGEGSVGDCTSTMREPRPTLPCNIFKKI